MYELALTTCPISIINSCTANHTTHVESMYVCACSLNILAAGDCYAKTFATEQLMWLSLPATGYYIYKSTYLIKEVDTISLQLLTLLEQES